MNKTIKIYLFIFIALLIAMMINDFSKPKPIDWKPSFLSSRKSPYGAYILHNELKSFFPKSKIRHANISPYEFMSNNYEILDAEENGEKYNYLFLNLQINLGEESSSDLLDFAAVGNTVFMSGHGFPRYLSDTLHFDVKHNFGLQPEIILELANKKLSRTKYSYEKGVEEAYFNELDSATTTVLGYNYLKNSQKKHINFVKIKYGKGNFILNTQPYAFANYHMLESDHAVYVSNCLSYLPDYTLIWDERSKAQTDEIRSPLRFILSKATLKYAWFTSLLSFLLFMLFRAKRRQRIIPIVEELPNTSIAFAKTIGNLYYQEGKPHDIINKKITFFLEYLRNTYLLDTQNLNDDFKKRLHLKSGIPKEEINRLIDYIINLSKNSEPKENSLVTLNKLIDKFYQKTKL